VAKLIGWRVFTRFFGFIDLSPITVVDRPNCRDRPAIGQRAVDALKVFSAFYEPAKNVQAAEHGGRLDEL
jgi:hypothetical protein